MKLIYDGRLPGLNETIGKARANRYIAAAEKKKLTEDVSWCFRAQTMDTFPGKVNVAINYYEKNMRRDPDNVTGGGAKIVMDALQMAEIIKNDSPKFVHLRQEVWYDKRYPRIEIEIKGAE